MHWNNGKFHQDITVGGKVYITDHKHTAIFGTKDSIGFGESAINSYMYGKDINMIANNKFYVDSTNGSYIRSSKNVDLSASTYVNIGAKSYINATANTYMNINAGTYANIKTGNYLNLDAGSGITLTNTVYGTELPTTGVEGRIFFKLIS